MFYITSQHSPIQAHIERLGTEFIMPGAISSWPFSQTLTHWSAIRSSFFSILPKDILTRRVQGPGVEQQSFWLVLLYPLSHSHPKPFKLDSSVYSSGVKLAQLLRAAVVEWARQWKKRGCNRSVNKAVNHKKKFFKLVVSHHIPTCRNIPLFGFCVKCRLDPVPRVCMCITSSTPNCSSHRLREQTCAGIGWGLHTTAQTLQDWCPKTSWTQQTNKKMLAEGRVSVATGTATHF